MNPKINVQDALRKLELHPTLFDFSTCRSFEEAQNKLKVCKDIVTKQRKVLAKKYHPDVSEHSPEKMQELNGLIDAFLKLQVNRPQPRPAVVFHVYRSSTSTSYSSTSTATSYHW